MATSAAAAWAANASALAQPAKGPNDRLGVGIIGCGGRSTAHIGALQELAERDKSVEIVALCTDLYPHVLTQVIHILGVKMPSKAVATGGIFRYPEREVPDTFNMLIDYPEKIAVALLGSQGNSYQATGNRDDIRVPVIRGWDGALTIEGEEIVFIPEDEAAKAGRKPQRFPIEHGYNMLFLMRNWVDCARNGSRALDSGPELAYYTQTALLMGMAAFRANKTAFFDPAKEEIVAG